MKISSQREKWAAAILGVVCVALLVNLLRSPFVRAGAPRPAAPPASKAERGTVLSNFADLSRYNPEVRLELLKQLDARPLPGLDRDPFQFGPTPEEVAHQKQVEEAAKNPQPPPPPPPPPVTVTALGYADGPGGVRKAFFQDEENTYEAGEGQSFADRYKVIKITPSLVTIEDQASHRPVPLQFPE